VASSSLDSVRACISHYRVPVLLVAATAVAATVLPMGVGDAAPSSHPSLSQVEAQVSALNVREEKITESFDSANVSLTALERKERVTNDLLARDRAALSRVERQVGASATAAYRDGAPDPALSLMSSGSAESFLNQTSSLDEVARTQAEEVATANAAQRQVAAAQVVHNAEVAQQRKTVSSISSSRSQIQGLLNQQQTLLNQLKASQRAALARAQAAAARAAVAERAQAPSAPTASPSSSSTGSPATYNGAAAGQAAVAIRYAYAQLGKPYQWGGAGPDSFDCSGLVMRAWGAAGVGLPHSAAGDQASLPSVSLSALEPGDLVFYGDPAFHVAIYIGGGRIIQAPHTGADVEISSIDDMTPTSAGRP
jgi:cell wall-associated NlpC family hydrolase